MTVVVIVMPPVAMSFVYRRASVVFDSGPLDSAIWGGIGMHISGTIGPRPPPGTAIDQDIMLAPSKANPAPSEWSERSANRNTRSKPENSSGHKSGTRP